MNVWKVLAWIFVVCGLLAYFIGWGALLFKFTVFGIGTEFWFYDAIATGIFGLFFLAYSNND